MKFDVLVAEIGSTTTVVNAFSDLDSNDPKFIAQGQAPTTVLEGDVNIGLNAAIKNLKANLNAEIIEYEQLVASSSAAGGLKMTVHGLVYDMTAKAAREAALGAGANIHLVTAGRLRRTDVAKIKEIKPNIILIAGGVDYGERDTALDNAEKIAAMDLRVPVLYAGNIENHQEIRLIFEEAGKSNLLHIVDNVYPRIDELNVEPTRVVIQDVFEAHITEAAGMEKLRKLVTGPVVPTPGAVMAAAKLLKESLGDLIVFDVGGATTDLHSVTEGTEDISEILLSPEPTAKRTVEGDLGVYVNMQNIVDLVGREEICKTLQIEPTKLDSLIANHLPIPQTEEQKNFVSYLTKVAVTTALERHAGGFRCVFGGCKKTLAVGKDLTAVRYVIATGGALSRLDSNIEILESILNNNRSDKLYPTKDAQILIDNDYIMASLGVLSRVNPKAALILIKKSLGLE